MALSRVHTSAKVADITKLLLLNKCQVTGYWHQTADERNCNPPQGNQEPLVVKEKVERPTDELGVSKSLKSDFLSFSALTLLVG